MVGGYGKLKQFVDTGLRCRLRFSVGTLVESLSLPESTGVKANFWSLLTGILLLPLWTVGVVDAGEPYAGCALGLVHEAKQAGLEFGYARRRGGYCDGETPQRHSGQMTLQSVTRGNIRFHADVLRVTVSGSGNYFLRGRDLRRSGRYRLDGPMLKGSLEIDLNAAIRPLEMEAEDLGLYAWRYDGITRRYAPVSQNHTALTKVVFRNPGRIAQISSVTLCRLGVDPCEAKIGSKVVDRAGGDALITLSLPPVSQPGVYRLTVVARERRPIFVTKSIDIDL